MGSVASQVVGKALGVVDHFSLRQAVGAGLTAGVTAGIGSTGVFGDIAKHLSDTKFALGAVTAVSGNLTSYASSKGALLQLTRTLALEWAAESITVNAISPGPIATDMMKPVIADPRRAEEFLRRIPMNRFGEPREIATAALFLASPASSFVTGADVVVDGGWMSA